MYRKKKVSALKEEKMIMVSAHSLTEKEAEKMVVVDCSLMRRKKMENTTYLLPKSGLLLLIDWLTLRGSSEPTSDR